MLFRGDVCVDKCRSEACEVTVVIMNVSIAIDLVDPVSKHLSVYNYHLESISDEAHDGLKS